MFYGTNISQDDAFMPCMVVLWKIKDFPFLLNLSINKSIYNKKGKKVSLPPQSYIIS